MGLLLSFDSFPVFISLLQPCQLHAIVAKGKPSKCKYDCASLSSAEILSVAPGGFEGKCKFPHRTYRNLPNVAAAHLFIFVSHTAHLFSGPPPQQYCITFSFQEATLLFTPGALHVLYFPAGMPSLHFLIRLLHLHPSTRFSWVIPLPPGSLPCIRRTFYPLPKHPVSLTITPLIF